jgi:hypothetical protein
MTDTPNTPVSLVDERLIRDGEAAVVEYGKSTSRSHHLIIPMARGLLAARHRYIADQDFGNWLEQSPYRDINHTDRAALLKIAEHEVYIVHLMRVSTLTSPRLIWETFGSAAQAMAVSHDVKPASGIDTTVKKGTVSHDVKPASGIDTTVKKPDRNAARSMRRDNSFYGRERADEVQAVYQKRITHTAISKVLRSRGGKELWNLILEAIDAGFLTETNYNSSWEAGLSLRILFPHDDAAGYCRKIDLSTLQAIKHVRDVVLPAMIAHRDFILADPSQIGKIMHRIEYDAREKSIEARVTARLAQRRVPMAKHEYDVVIYGQVFWPNPRPDVTDYSYDQVRAACWYFHEHDQLFRMMYPDSAKSRAMQIRFSPRWFSQYADRELTSEPRDKIKTVFRLIHAMTLALEENPTGASNRPPPPTTDGEWP